MQYTITHRCGHQLTVTLYGPHKERDRKLRWLKSDVCDKCLRERQRLQNEIEVGR